MNRGTESGKHLFDVILRIAWIVGSNQVAPEGSGVTGIAHHDGHGVPFRAVDRQNTRDGVGLTGGIRAHGDAFGRWQPAVDPKCARYRAERYGYRLEFVGGLRRDSHKPVHEGPGILLIKLIDVFVASEAHLGAGMGVRRREQDVFGP